MQDLRFFLIKNRNGKNMCFNKYFVLAMGRIVTSIVLEHTLYPPNVLLRDPLDNYPSYPTTQRPKIKFTTTRRTTTTRPTTTTRSTTTIKGISNNVFFNSTQQNVNNVCGMSTSNSDIISPFISNGIKTSPGEWPWLVAIFIVMLEFKFHCAGSLVTNRHIITGILRNRRIKFKMTFRIFFMEFWFQIRMLCVIKQYWLILPSFFYSCTLLQDRWDWSGYTTQRIICVFGAISVTRVARTRFRKSRDC